MIFNVIGFIEDCGRKGSRKGRFSGSRKARISGSRKARFSSIRCSDFLLF